MNDFTIYFVKNQVYLFTYLPHYKGMIYMQKKDFINNLLSFIPKASCAFTGIKEIETILKEQNFSLLTEQEKWENIPPTFYVKRNDSSIIAVKIPKEKSNAFHIITTHIDTPSLELKPNGVYLNQNYLGYNVMPYGGLLNYGWLDKNLSIAGRICLKKKNNWETRIVDAQKTVAVIPSVAIHQNDMANSKLDLNMQVDLQPIFALTNDEKTWDSLYKIFFNLKKEEELGDFELFLYDNSLPTLFGFQEELLISPRIDNLTSVYSGLTAFLNSKPKNIAVFVAFNSEEIGSLTKEGAESSFLLDTLKRIASFLNLDITSTLAQSFIISADNTHAIHPNHPEYADKTSIGKMGEGFAIIKEVTSVTDAIFSSLLKDICCQEKIKFQNVTAKNDLAGGSTLSGLSLRHVSVSSIDVGIVELAMHSSKEVCATKDIYALYQIMKSFYNHSFIIKKETYHID